MSLYLDVVKVGVTSGEEDGPPASSTGIGEYGPLLQKLPTQRFPATELIPADALSQIRTKLRECFPRLRYWGHFPDVSCRPPIAIALICAAAAHAGWTERTYVNRRTDVGVE